MQRTAAQNHSYVDLHMPRTKVLRKSGKMLLYFLKSCALCHVIIHHGKGLQSFLKC